MSLMTSDAASSPPLRVGEASALFLFRLQGLSEDQLRKMDAQKMCDRHDLWSVEWVAGSRDHELRMRGMG